MDMLSRAFYLGILLVFINSMFLFTGTLPNGAGGYMDFGMSQSDKNDMNTFNQTYLDMNQELLGPGADGNAITTVSSQDKGYLTLFLETLFGSVNQVFSLVGSVLGIISSIFFGFVYWIDYFINPAWFPGLLYINLAIKSFLILVQVLAMFYLVKDIFGLGTGTRA